MDVHHITCKERVSQNQCPLAAPLFTLFPHMITSPLWITRVSKMRKQFLTILKECVPQLVHSFLLRWQHKDLWRFLVHAAGENLLCFWLKFVFVGMMASQPRIIRLYVKHKRRAIFRYTLEIFCRPKSGHFHVTPILRTRAIILRTQMTVPGCALQRT